MPPSSGPRLAHKAGWPAVLGCRQSAREGVGRRTDTSIHPVCGRSSIVGVRARARGRRREVWRSQPSVPVRGASAVAFAWTSGRRRSGSRTCGSVRKPKRPSSRRSWTASTAAGRREPAQRCQGQGRQLNGLLLALLAEQEGATTAELAVAVHRRRADVTAALRRLELAGLVERVRRPHRTQQTFRSLRESRRSSRNTVGKERVGSCVAQRTSSNRLLPAPRPPLASETAPVLLDGALSAVRALRRASARTALGKGTGWRLKRQHDGIPPGMRAMPVHHQRRPAPSCRRLRSSRHAAACARPTGAAAGGGYAPQPN
jgi:DNA-binding MarR family transcriptional regulator